MVPGHGWDYRAFRALAEDPSLPTPQLGQKILDLLRFLPRPLHHDRKQGQHFRHAVEIHELRRPGVVRTLAELQALAPSDAKAAYLDAAAGSGWSVMLRKINEEAPRIRRAAEGEPIAADITLVFDGSGAIVARYLYLEQGGVWSEVEPEPGATLTPVLLVGPVPSGDVELAEPSWEERGKPMKADAQLVFTFVDADAVPEVTAMLFELFASDAEDNFDVVYGEVELVGVP